jgi:hypothetical protein
MSDPSHDRLLPGEDPDTQQLDDAELWVQVYSELIGVKHDLMARLDGHLSGLSKPAQAELTSVDQELLRDQVARFERRLEFWQSRKPELEKNASEVREGGEAQAPT